MKFLKLDICNINSLEKVTIDFENLLPSDEHIFLIWGPSGSGKSTILDSISLALFKKVPRLEGIPNKNSKYEDSEYQVSGSKGRSISTDDIRQYLKRGKKSGYCSLDFVGNDGKKYTASLNFSINKNNNLNDAKWLLTTPTKTFDKTTQIAPIIEDVTGMTYDQFCRTTLLAQGEFTKFMKSDQNSKAAILEKLTDTGIFSSIGKKIFEICSSKKKEFDELHKENQNVKRLSDDEISVYNGELTSIGEEIESIQQVENQINVKINWLNQEKINKENLSAAERELQKATSDLQNPEISQTEMEIQLWEKTEEQRILYVNLESAKAQLASFNGELSNICKTFDNLVAGRNFLNVESERLKQQKSKLDKQYKLYSSRKDIFAQSSYWKEKLKNFEQLKSNLEAASSEIKTINKNLADKKVELENINNDIKKTNSQLNSKTAEREDVYKKIRDVDYQKILQEIANDNSALTKISDIRSTADNLKKYQNDIKNLKDQIISNERKLEISKNQQDKVQEDLKTAEKNRDLAYTLYEASLNSVHDFAKKLRNSLKVGDSCPICGNTIDHVLSNEAVEASVAALYNKYEEAKNNYNKINSDLMSITAFISQISAENEGKKTDYNNKCAEKDKLLDSLQKISTELQIVVDPTLYDQLSAKEQLINNKLSDNQSLKNSYESNKIIYDSLEKGIKSLNESINKSAIDLTTIKGKISSLQEKISSKETEIKEYNTKIKEEETLISSSLAEFYADWALNISKTSSEIDNDKSVFESVEKQLSENQNKSDSIEKEISESEIIIKRVADKYGWKINNTVCECKDLTQKCRQLDRDCDLIDQKITEKRNLIQDYKQKLEEFLTSNSDIDLEVLKSLSRLQHSEIKSKRNKIDAVRKCFQNAQGKVENAKRTVERHNGEKPEMTEAETLNYLTEAVALQKEKRDEKIQRKSEINVILKEDVENKLKYAKTLEKLDKLKLECDDWERLNTVFGDSNGMKFCRIAQSYILNKLLENANFFLGMLSDRYQLINPGKDLLILVKDRYLNDSPRPVEMVSGGESFIISIALALGLSNMSMQGITSDFIFIDEGISQLDGTRCDNVVNTLQQLHSIIKCNIGLISHLDKLTEVIPTKINVYPVSQGTSEVKVVRN